MFKVLFGVVVIGVIVGWYIWFSWRKKEKGYWEDKLTEVFNLNFKVSNTAYDNKELKERDVKAMEYMRRRVRDKNSYSFF